MSKLINDKYYIPSSENIIKCDFLSLNIPYAQEVYFYCNKKEYLQQMKELLSLSSKKISVMRLYKYLKDNIEGIE